jgi:type I restriction enzyme S subunit
MSDLPPGWELVQLKEIAEIRLGRQRSPKNHSGIDMRPYLRAANVDWSGLKLDDVKSMNFTEEEAGIYRLQPRDILLNEASGSADEVGKPALWNGEIDDCCFQNTLLRVRSSGPDPKYLLYFFRHEALRGAFAERVRGVSIFHLGAVRLSAWEISLPPIAEQYRIVAALEDHLSRLDAGVTSLVKSDRRMASLWRSVSNSATLGPLATDATRWPIRSVGEVTTVQGGIQKQPKRRPIKNKFPFLRVANVSRGGLVLREIHEIELFDGELERYRLQSGDLLVVEGNGSAEQIGRAAMWRGEIPDCVHQNHLIRVRPRPELDPRFLELVWNAPKTAEQLRRVASSTSGLYTLSTAKVKSIQIPVPPLDVQRAIVAAADVWSSRITALQTAIDSGRRRAAILRRSLLADAFAGRLVPQDPSDEPASELLARIRAERLAQERTRSTRRARRLASKRTSIQQETLL